MYVTRLVSISEAYYVVRLISPQQRNVTYCVRGLRTGNKTAPHCTALHCTINRQQEVKGSGTAIISFVGSKHRLTWLCEVVGKTAKPFMVTGGSSRRDHASPHGTRLHSMIEWVLSEPIAVPAGQRQGRPRSPPESPQSGSGANPFGLWWNGRDPPVQELVATLQIWTPERELRVHEDRQLKKKT